MPAQFREAEGTEISKTEECNLIVRSVRAIKLPTLTLNDTTRFIGLMRDCFPEAAMSDISNNDLETAIRKVLDRRNMMIVPLQVRPNIHHTIVSKQEPMMTVLDVLKNAKFGCDHRLKRFFSCTLRASRG